MVSEYIRVCRCGRWLGIMPSSWIVKFCMVLPFIGRSIQKDWLRRSHWTQPKKHAPSNVCVKMLPGSISSCCASGVDGASIKSTPTYPWLCNWYHRRTTRWGWCNVLFCTVLATEIKTAFGTIFFEKNCVQAAAEFKIIFCRILNLVLHCGDSVSLNRAVFRKGQVWGWLRNTSFLHSRIQHAKLGNQPFCFWNKHPDCDTGLGVIDGHSVEFIHSHTFHTLWMRESTVAPAWFQSVSFQRIPSNCTVFMLLFPFLVVKTENWSFCACFWCEPIRNTLADCHKKKKKKKQEKVNPKNWPSGQIWVHNSPRLVIWIPRSFWKRAHTKLHVQAQPCPSRAFHLLTMRGCQQWIDAWPSYVFSKTAQNETEETFRIPAEISDR